MRSLALVALVVSSGALAQAPAATFSLERLRLNDGLADGLVVPTGDGLGRRELRLGLFAHYEKEPLVLLADGVRQGALVDSRLTTHVVGAFGFSSFLMLAAELPVVVSQSGQSFPSLGVPAVAPVGLGPLWLAGRLSVLSEGTAALVKEAPLDLAVSFGATSGFGSAAALASDATSALVPSVSVGRALGSVRVGGEAAVLVRTSAAAVSGTGVATGTEALLGVSAALALGAAHLEASARCALPLSVAGPAGVELLVGARGPVGPVELFAVAGPGLGKLPGTPSFRALAGVSWTWSASRAADAAE